MCEICSQLGIPERLHKRNRKPDQEFNSEDIYRRFKAVGNREDWKKDSQISAAIFPVKNDSCIRQKYSQHPQDVLYNAKEENNEGHYFESMSVLAFNTGILDKFNQAITQNGIERIFKLSIKHDPIKCMYPHCEILVTENGEVVNQNKPKSIKVAVRDILLEYAQIISE